MSYDKPYTRKATLDHARPCPCCKRPAKKVTSTVVSNEPYDGNMVLVRSVDRWKSNPNSQENNKRYPDNDLYKRYEHIVWDGRKYIHRYGFFCSQQCAVYYANNGEALNFHGKLFNELAIVQPITTGVFEIKGENE